MEVVKEASTAAVSLMQADLPRWTAEAEKAGKGAVAFAERLLKDVPKVVDMCKTELEKQLAKEGQQAMIKKVSMKLRNRSALLRCGLPWLQNLLRSFKLLFRISLLTSSNRFVNRFSHFSRTDFDRILSQSREIL